VNGAPPAGWAVSVPKPMDCDACATTNVPKAEPLWLASVIAAATV